MADDKTFQEWKQMGDDLKEIQKKISEFICNPSYQKLLTTRIIDKLWKVNDRICAFKSQAEDRMFNKVRPPRDDGRWLWIFYEEPKNADAYTGGNGNGS